MPATYSSAAQAVHLLRVLIVEDDPIQLALLKAMLLDSGVRLVAEAVDGQGGLDRLADGRFDLVITDLRMDGMDGVEFLSRALALHGGAFAFSSAVEPDVLASAESIAHLQGASLIGALGKPLQIGELQALLRRAAAACAPSGQPERQRPAQAWPLSALATALEWRQFFPVYQPKLDLNNGEVTGVEVLARWRHPTAGLIAPAQFIATMEQTELIDVLFRQLLRQALADLASWEAQGQQLSLAINIAPRTLEDRSLPERLVQQVREAGIAPERISFELTETAISRHPATVLESVTRLRLRGFQVAVDDFGVGYSSLALLSALPFSELKIDRSFIAGMPLNGKVMPILESIMRLAKELGLRTVAEGIETGAERDFLRALGCEAGQGFLFGKPMNGPCLAAWLASRRA
ncbi:EAL domain-containing protein [Massilia sp. TS11]|uniref:EAL domain-containing response regulator n=1 Tax=Massilia sp. TS11 TaxID=2908003 RepID=UPI001EDB01D9|nr:EAL domain-containing response regulator [Massilia sp. TS11]MCG2584750.1 EAL domain-containing response regulator [Massilia sp. TS11]